MFIQFYFSQCEVFEQKFKSIFFLILSSMKNNSFIQYRRSDQDNENLYHVSE